MRNGERERGAKRRVTKMRERDWWIEWDGLDVTIVSKRNKRSVGVERKDLGLEMDSRREISKLGAGDGREEKMSAGGRDYFVSEQKNEAQVFPNWIHVLQNYIIMCFFSIFLSWSVYLSPRVPYKMLLRPFSLATKKVMSRKLRARNLSSRNTAIVIFFAY